MAVTRATSMRRLGGVLMLTMWMAALVGCLRLLGLIGRGALGAPPVTHGMAAVRAWAATRDASTVTVATLRVVAIGLAWYLLATSAAGIVARLSGVAAAVRITDVVTLPSVRRLLAAAAGLALLTATTPAFAATSQLPARTAPTAPAPVLSVLPALRPPALIPVTTRTPPDRALWTVQPGDSFWRITASVLEAEYGRPPTDAEIVPVWRQIIAQNRHLLADPDNDDLIYPGQRFTVVVTPGGS